MLYGILVFAVSLVLSYAFTPISMRLAHSLGAIDVPRDNRRVHARPIPRLGGVAISAAVLLSTMVFCTPTPTLRAVWAGGTAITVLGIADDSYTLSPSVKLFGQTVAVMLAVRAGAVMDYLTFFGHYLPLGCLAVPATVLWILLLTNAVNLIDGLDGLSCGVSAISALAVFVITAMADVQVCALTASAVFGACLGFYPYNKHPARTFAGDTGAQYLGFVLAVVSVDGVFKLPLFLSIFLPPLVFLFPLSDTLLAVVRRLSRGQSPFHADKEHMHHRLLARGFSHRQTVMLLWIGSAISAASALLALGHGVYPIALLLVCVLLVLLYVCIGHGRHPEDK